MKLRKLFSGRVWSTGSVEADRALTSDGRRLALGMVIVLLMSLNVAVWTQRSVAAPADDPRLSLARAIPTTVTEPPPPPTTVPPPATTTPVKVAAPRRTAVNVPRDPYAAEPVKQIGEMQIPKIGLKHSIWEGITMRNINNGPSHWPGTAMPGNVGNTVFAGHRVTRTHPFKRINELVPGDEVIFIVGGRRSVYKVTRHEIVTPKDTWISKQTPDATGTLFACHPPGQKSHRYVVRLALVSSG